MASQTKSTNENDISLDDQARVLALLDEALLISPTTRLRRAVNDARRAVAHSVRDGASKSDAYQSTRRSISGSSESIPPSSDMSILNIGASTERE